ncbi:hypothetical protein THASP1DRAFT_29136 [Thamnocephalis sphaerospora]|uniref:Uncharacterized protein n=1 Tax=Thamnocephalis sphaerospora TaxID=78915 RepID=A0A4V1IWX5_9FUNG|nr:hypothetical protein THASP1DRAFT_29136 [Thamnocephalis sphaerospora]|eukprot:RKP09079.1 hypothetical protein THASP1DRAFT_29136 [Thamnocephalis sphaerospora]
MLRPNTPPEVLCSPNINIYDCSGSEYFFYAVLACQLSTVVTLATGFWVCVYRYRHGIAAAQFRRVNGYWMPAALDAFLFWGTLSIALRTVMFLFVLLDWPRSLLFREAFNMLMTAAPLFSVTLLTVGIISHIPPAFSHRSTPVPNFARCALRSCSCGVATCQATSLDRALESGQTQRPALSAAVHSDASRVAICTPSTRLLYWIAIVFSAQLFAVNIANGALIGWSQDIGDIAMTHMLHRLGPLYFAASVLTLMAVTMYYGYGFYRILRAYVRRAFCHHQMDDEELAAAQRFKLIFFYIFLALAVAFALSLAFAISSDMFSRSLWLAIGGFVFEYGIAYPGIQCALYYSISQGSYARRRRAATVDSTGLGKPASAAERQSSPFMNGESGSMASPSSPSADMTAAVSMTAADDAASVIVCSVPSVSSQHSQMSAELAALPSTGLPRSPGIVRHARLSSWQRRSDLPTMPRRLSHSLTAGNEKAASRRAMRSTFSSFPLTPSAINSDAGLTKPDWARPVATPVIVHVDPPFYDAASIDGGLASADTHLPLQHRRSDNHIKHL